jgi:hypothetical protein
MDVKRGLGWRIMNAMRIQVVKDRDGKSVVRCNLEDEMIQSHSLLKPCVRSRRRALSVIVAPKKRGASSEQHSR